MKFLTALLVTLLIAACSTPEAQARKARKEFVDDSLRTETKAALHRIDSLKKLEHVLRKTLDSLDIPPPK